MLISEFTSSNFPASILDKSKISSTITFKFLPDMDNNFEYSCTFLLISSLEII